MPPAASPVGKGPEPIVSHSGTIPGGASYWACAAMAVGEIEGCLLLSGVK